MIFMNTKFIMNEPTAPPECEVYNTTCNQPTVCLNKQFDSKKTSEISDVRLDSSYKHIYVGTKDSPHIEKYDFEGQLCNELSGVRSDGFCFDSKRDLLVSVSSNGLTRRTRLGAIPGMWYNAYVEMKKARKCNSIVYVSKKDRYVVNDIEQNCVFVVEASSGEVLTRIGGKKSNCTAFKRPQCVSASVGSSRPFIAVSDSLNHNVKVFSLKGKLRGVYGRYGAGEGHLMNPAGLHVDIQGRVVVCDSSNKRVVRFNPNSETAEWECVISPEQLGYRHPSRIHISDNGHVVVSSSQDNGSVWTLFSGYC